MNRTAVHLVIVTPDDRQHQIWAAATSRDQAVACVLNAIPEGWAARLLDPKAEAHRLKSMDDLCPGEVRKLFAVSEATGAILH